MTENLTLTPPIFEGVDRVKSVVTLVGERTAEQLLGNNMTIVPGNVRDGLKLVGVHEDDLEEAVALEVVEAAARRARLIESMGLGSLRDVVACPSPAHGANFVDVNASTMPKLRVDSPDRAKADIAFITQPGHANLLAFADCLVIDIVDPNAGGQVAQVHAGHEGEMNDVVVITMKELEKRGMNPAHALVNIHPNATEGFELRGEKLEAWKAKFADFVTEGADGKSYIDMTGAAVAQLEEAGILEGRIQTSKAYSTDGKDLNTLTDDRFYSHRAKGQKGFNGRNAAVLARVKD
jgi:copper oxidase (laccase) domain-containing protein